ncbi:MAG TPA: MotA/TolQ/ExbB proton channel family protein [Polyangiaceae bacterium]
MIIEKLLRVALLGSSWVLYLMIALSVVSIGAMLERAVYFMRRNVDVDELGDELIKLLEKGDHEGATKLLDEKSKRSIEASVLAPAMMYLDASPDALEDRIDSELVAARQEMERGTNLLGTLGNNAPFIGLFGTVIGVIIAFQQLSHTNGAGNMGNVMAGIAEALVATGVGLFVAIPAVVAYNVIQKRIGDVEGNVTALTKRVTAHLKAVNSGWTKQGSRHVHRLASGA